MFREIARKKQLISEEECKGRCEVGKGHTDKPP
jgi:hypothetical protein